MAIYEAEYRTIVINYLNEKDIKLLELLFDYSPIRSNNIIKYVLERDIMSESSFYRYINFLVQNKIVDKSKSRKKSGGYLYEINEDGRYIYQLIIDSNFKCYNKLMPRL